MDININNWKVKLIRSAFKIEYSNDLPKSLCTFFWTFVSAVVLFPISIFGHIFNLREILFNKNKDLNLVNGTMMGIFSLFAGGVIGWKTFQNTSLKLPTNPGSKTLYDVFIDFVSLYYYAAITIVLLIVIGIVVIAIISLAEVTIKKIREKNEALRLKEFIDRHPEFKDESISYQRFMLKKEEKENKIKKSPLIIQYLIAAKNKMCPRIEYK